MRCWIGKIRNRFLWELFIVVWSVRSVCVADSVWTNTASGSWGDASNWSEGIVPGGEGIDMAVFTNDIVTDITVTLDDNRTVNRLIFGDDDTASAAGWAVEAGSGGSLTLGGESPTVIVDELGTGKTADIRVEICGVNGFTKAGTGTLVLSAVNTYGSATAISAGRLVLSDTILPLSNQLSIASGTTLEYATTQGTQRQCKLDLSGSGTLLKTGAGTLTFGENSGNIIKWNLGSGAWIDVQGGTLVGGSWYNDDWSANLASLNIAAGAVFRGDEANVRVAKLTGNGTVKTGYDGARYTAFTIGLEDGSGTFGGGVVDDESVGNVIKTGTGVLTFSGTSTYTGNTDIEGGTFKVSGCLYSGGAASSAVVHVHGGSILELDSWEYGAGASLGLLDETAQHIVLDNGTLRMARTTNGGRGVTVNAGGAVLEVLHDAVWDISNEDEPWVCTGSPALILAGEGRGVFRKRLSGLGSLVKTGSGQWVLAGTNVSVSAVNVVCGTLQLTVAYDDYSAPVPGAALWLDATRGVSVDGTGHVTVWADQSGNGHDATNEGSTGPTVTSDINKLSTLRFMRSQSQYLCAGGLGSVSNLTIFIVHKLASVNGLQTFIGTDGDWTGDDSAGSAGRSVHLITSELSTHPINYAVYNMNGTGLIPQSANTARVDVVVDNGGSYQLFENGQTNGSGIRATVKKNLTAFRIGTWDQQARYLDASIGELIIYTNVLNEAERQVTYGYLKAKWLDDKPSQNVFSNQCSDAATANVGADSVLNLGGQSQTFAGVAGSGLITNGMLTVIGTVAPGGGGVVGTLTLASTLTLGGMLSIDVSADSCDRLVVNGSLDLSTLLLKIENPAQLDRSRVYTLIDCTGELTGVFLPTSELPGAWVIQYDRGNGDVFLVYRGGTLISLF